MGHIFISYSREDQAYVDDLVTAIRDYGFDVWIDKHIKRSDRWWKSIEQAIRECSAFVVVMSPDSDESPWVEREIMLAEQEGKPIFPLLLREPGITMLLNTQHEDVTSGRMPPIQFYVDLDNIIKRKDHTGEFVGPKPDDTLSERPAVPSNRRLLLGGGAALIAVAIVIAVLAVLLSGGDSESSSMEDTATATVETATTTQEAGTPVAEEPSPTASRTASVTTTTAPTLSETQVEATVQAEMAAIITEEAMTVEAEALLTASVEAQHGQETRTAQTLTATAWTLTPTIDTRGTAQARLTLEAEQTATQMALDQTATATLWTDTPTNTSTNTPSSTPSPTATSPTTDALTVARQGVASNAEWLPFRDIQGTTVVDFGDGVEMVLVPAGCFMMGSTDEQVDYAFELCEAARGEGECRRSWFEDEQPPEEICFEEPFWIDRYEVSNGQFNRLASDAGRASYWTDDDLPRERITWYEARDFCEQRGARLPTEAEWEYAARGPDSLIYPWGNEFEADNVVYSGNSGGETAPIGSRPGGVSWVGAYDMSGNVDEWVSSWYADYPYDPDDGREGDNGYTHCVLRGGFYWDGDYLVRAPDRNSLDPLIKINNVGARCIRNY